MKSGVHSLGQGAMDLSLKTHPGLDHFDHQDQVGRKSPTAPTRVVLLKPEPRPAWSILWYQSIWPKTVHHGFSPEPIQPLLPIPGKLGNISNSSRAGNELRAEVQGVDLSLRKGDLDLELEIKTPPISTKGGTAITDIATCDGPVHFQRISNPNFALTVEHRETSTTSRSGDLAPPPPPSHAPPSKTYLCIYCNQSFKSLFCYQKHKKRHLNPVSVDITPSVSLDLVHTLSESTIRSGGGADLNVQFFPCKKCGSKFPSYYFVHKHKRVCDPDQGEEDGDGDLEPVQ